MRAFVNLQISQLRNEIESKQSQIAELKDEGQKVTLAFQQLQREHGKLKEEETEKSKKLQVGGGRLGTFCFKIKSPFHLGEKANVSEPLEAFGDELCQSLSILAANE